MNTLMAETSLAAYHSLPVKDYLQKREREIVEYLREVSADAGGLVRITREGLADELARKESSICGRVNSLLAKGVLVEDGEAKTASGRAAKLVRLSEEWSALEGKQ